VIVDLDDVVWRGRPTTPDEIDLIPDAITTIDTWDREGRIVVATAWQPAIATGEMTDAAMVGLISALRERIPAIRAVAYCPHPAGPPICWCRKPLPGMGLVLARDHDLDLSRSIHAGRSAADRGFASRLGMTFVTI
jgi:histidinol phosphatase-like enzyme